MYLSCDVRSFFIHGGLVFTPLTQPYLQEVSIITLIYIN